MQTEAVFENIAEKIHHELNKAQKSIFIAVAWFTNKFLFNELIEKARNGCTVLLIISNDKINHNSSIDFDELKIGNSNVYKIGNGETELMHNKFCIIDYSTTITGSYNWSYKAESNFENIVITSNDTNLADQFIVEFRKLQVRYFPEDQNPESVFPIGNIIKRLEILKNLILLEEIEEIKNACLKLKDYKFNQDLCEIIDAIESKEYLLAINRIQDFNSNNQQLGLWNDPELSALKFEIKNLENKLNSFDNEKIELEKLLTEFQYRHTAELGEIILNILKLRKRKFKSDNPKFKEAEKDEKQYREQFDTENRKEIIITLTHEEKLELKKRFRKATAYCHPDKVSDEFKENAESIFIELKKAYDTNNLKRVTELANNLEKGRYFKARSETVTEKDILKNAILKLKTQIKLVENEIINIKLSDTFKTIIEIKNWDDYFINLKAHLNKELETLKIEIENNQ